MSPLSIPPPNAHTSPDSCLLPEISSLPRAAKAAPCQWLPHLAMVAASVAGVTLRMPMATFGLASTCVCCYRRCHLEVLLPIR